MKENRQFFDGLILGGIIAGLILVTVLVFLSSQREKGAGPQQQKPAQENMLFEDATSPEDISSEIGQTTLLEGEEYRVVEVFRHPDDSSMVLRIVAPAGASTVATNCVPKGALLTKFGKNGEELIALDNQWLEKLAKITLIGAYCVNVEKWTGDGIILTDSYGDAGAGSIDVYRYEPEGDYTRLLGYSEIWSYPDDETAQATHRWASGEYSLVQFQTVTGYTQADESNTTYSDLYYLDPSQLKEGESIDDYLEDTPIAIKTNGRQVGVMLTSDLNIRDFERGLHIVIDHNEHFIPWIKN